MDPDLEFVISNNGTVGIFLPPLVVNLTNFRVDRPKLVLIGDNRYFELNPPPLFLDHANASGRILLVECKRGAIFKEYEIELEVIK